jgi:hypothetical protein
VGARRVRPTSASALGTTLAALFRGAQRIRHPRPIHSRGAVFDAVVTWRGGAESGIAWVDQPAGTRQTGVARVSRSLGLPPALPDVLGLALRVETADGPADVELSTGAIGVPGRFLLTLQRTPRSAWFSTLLPYRGREGSVLLGARLREPQGLPTSPREQGAVGGGPWTVDLFAARPTGRWRRFGALELTTSAVADDASAIRFDALRRPLPGADVAPWHRRLREPSYRAVQDPR